MTYLKSNLYFAFTMIFSANLWSNNEEHHINWWGLGSEYGDSPAVGWQIFTFIVFVSLLIYFAKKPVSAYLDSRAKEIEKLISDAEKAMALAIS